MNRLSSSLLLSLALLYGCTGKPAATDKVNVNSNPGENSILLDSIQRKHAAVVTTIATLTHMHSTIRVNGTVDVPPQSLVSVSFPLGGYLKNTPLLPGYQITKGQVIAVMEDQGYVQLQQDYLTAKARMEYLSADRQRQKDLSDADAASKKNYQLVLSDYKIQQVLLKSLGEKLAIIHINPASLTVNNISRTVPIYAPITGYVSKVNVNIGKYVNPSDVLFELINTNDIHAAITVFEKDINAFRKGLKGKVALVDRPGEWYDIETILVSRNLDGSRSGLVHCHFEKAAPGLLPGMFLNAVFEMDDREVTAIADDAIVHYSGKDYLFITEDDKKFNLIPIQTGERENGMTEIKLSPDRDWQRTKIVVSGAYALLGKMKNKMEN